MAYIIYSATTRDIVGVVNTTDPDSLSLRKDELAIPCPANTNPSHSLDSWRAKGELMLNTGIYAPDVESAKEKKRIELIKARDKAISDGFLHSDGNTYPISPDVQVQMLTMFQGSMLLPAPGYSWKDINGIYQSIGNAEAFQAFCTAAMGYGQSLYAREEMLQSHVNGLDDIEAIGCVNWGTIPEPPTP